MLATRPRGFSVKLPCSTVNGCAQVSVMSISLVHGSWLVHMMMWAGGCADGRLGGRCRKGDVSPGSPGGWWALDALPSTPAFLDSLVEVHLDGSGQQSFVFEHDISLMAPIAICSWSDQ